MPDKPYNSGQWTEARFNSFIKSALRSASVRWPPRYETLKEARVDRGVYKCAGYKRRAHKVPVSLPAPPGKKLRVKNVQVNHKVPVVPPGGFDYWDSVIFRLFCEKPGLEVLCHECHSEHTRDMRNTEEEWRSIKDCPQYEVSNFGRVRHIDNGFRRLVKDTYLRVRMWSPVQKRYIFQSVHRLVAEAFLPNPNNLPEVNHIDGYKYNNMLTNLEWVTSAGNKDHASRLGLLKTGVNHPNFKGWWITPKGKFVTCKSAAEAEGRSTTTIYHRCKKGTNGYSFQRDHKNKKDK